MLSAQRPIEARAPGRRHDLRLLVLELMRPVLFTSKKKQTMEKQTM